VPREALKTRVLTGLRNQMMTPAMAAEAMRAYAEETNRLNRERRATAEATRRELADTAKAIAETYRREWVGKRVSTPLYSTHIAIAASDQILARIDQLADRDQTAYE